MCTRTIAKKAENAHYVTKMILVTNFIIFLFVITLYEECQTVTVVIQTRPDVLWGKGYQQRTLVDKRVKETNIWAIILVPLIMTLSRGHTGQIKRTVIMRWLWLAYRGNKVAQWRDLVFYDKILIFILVIEIVIYTGKSPLEAPIILWATETVPYQLIL